MTMFATRKALSRFAPAAAAALTVGVGSVSANPILHYDLWVTGGSAAFNNPGGGFDSLGAATADPQKFIHNGSLVDPGFGEWAVIYNTTSDPDPSVGSASLSSGLTIENRMADIGAGQNHLQFVIRITLPVIAPNLPATFGGNAGMTLNITPGSPGTLTSLPGQSVYTGMINGANAAGLYAPGFLLGGSNGPATASTAPGQSFTPFAFNNPVNSMGILVQFDLSPGETVTFNDFFAFVPTPGALSLFLVGGLLGRGRRRSA